MSYLNQVPSTEYRVPSKNTSVLATHNPQLATHNSQLTTRNSQLTTRNSYAGFSLIELMIVCFLMSIIMAAIFSHITTGQERSVAEATKLDLFQESREFMDQLTRDLRASGYPNTRNYSSDPVSPAEQSPQEAIGLVKIDVGSLWFESCPTGGCGTATGASNVSVIRYDLISTGPGCPCMKRSQADKVQGDPVTGQNETDQTEVQNILNGTTADPIFQAYYADGTSVPLPTDITSTDLVNVNTVSITLKVQSPYPDLKTGQKATMTLLSTVRLSNCSVAYPNTPGTVMGCK